MKKRIKYLVIISIFLGVGAIFTTTIIEAKKEKEKEIVFEKDKIDKKSVYSIKRTNNKYKISSDKLKDKKLENIFYDDVNVYLYYDNDNKATLLKYNIEAKKVIILYEDEEKIHGGISKIGKYYKIGDSFFDKNFKELKNSPIINEEEILYPTLDKVLYKTDEGIFIKDLDTEASSEMIANTDSESYDIYSISNDGKNVLLIKNTNNKSEIVVVNNNNEVINTFPYKQSNDIKSSYYLLNGGLYLLEKKEETDKKSYVIYDVTTKDAIYKSSDKYEDYIFDNTKFICNDKNGNIKLVDYVTNEEKTLLNKNDMHINKFILSSDNYSVVVNLMDDDFTFYIFYL